jgi:hypothetical protein
MSPLRAGEARHPANNIDVDEINVSLEFSPR